MAKTMNVLHLTLKKKWFDMILSGEKKEEYRLYKWFWVKRLMKPISFVAYEDWYPEGIPTEIGKHLSSTYTLEDILKAFNSMFKMFDVVCFRNGYAKYAPEITIECLGIDIGPAKPEWSDNWQGSVFRIKLGKIIETKNICPTTNS